MASSRVSVVLPDTTEGFYLPALEAMCLSDMVVVPDRVGNRSFCHHEINCLMPGFNVEALLEAVRRALNAIDTGEAQSYRLRALETLSGHSLDRERQDFHDILDNLDQIW